MGGAHQCQRGQCPVGKITEFGLDARSFAGVRIAAVGTKTAAAIRELGITPELLPSPHSAKRRRVVEVFPEYDEDLDPVGRVLLPPRPTSPPTCW